MVQLSERLKTLADMLSVTESVADVGCDHGYVSIYLVQQGRVSKAYAMDVRKGPLCRAREHIREYGFDNYIEARLSDGVGALSAGEARSMICAGMGGRLMMRILSEGKDIVDRMEQLILQPQSDVALLRRFLKESGYCTTAEEMVWEDGKFYPMMKLEPGDKIADSPDTEARQLPEGFTLEEKYGGLLIQRNHPVLRRYLTEALRQQEDILHLLQAKAEQSDRSRSRMEEIQAQITDMRAALAQMGAL